MASATTTVRGVAPLADAVRAAQPDLADEPTAVLIRIALVLLAGYAAHSVVSDMAKLVKGSGRTSPLPDMTDITPDLATPDKAERPPTAASAA